MQGTVRAIGGHKGVALALLVDLLVASTTHSLLPGDAPSVYTSEGDPPRLGHLIIGIDPVGFGVADAAARTSQYLDALTSEGDAMRIPRARRRENRNRATAQGIDVAATLLDELRPARRTEQPLHGVCNSGAV